LVEKLFGRNKKRAAAEVVGVNPSGDS
jgi:hypothetical protein